jgi:soluble lytic murein transglycosylase-like protein
VLALLLSACTGAPPEPTAGPPAQQAEPRPNGPPTAQLLARAEHDRSQEALAALAASPGGDFDDWRLRVLADHSPTRSHREEWLAELLERHPTSSLAESSATELALLRLERGDADGAWRVLERRWQTSHHPDLLAEAFRAAPDPGTELAIAARVAEVTPALLARLDLHRLSWTKAGAEQVYAFSIAGAPVLARTGQVARARAWLAAVAPSNRDLKWQLALAQVELRGSRPRAALAALADLASDDANEAATVHTTRAEVLLALAKGERRLASAHTAAALRELEAASQLPSELAARAATSLVTRTTGPRQRAAIRRLATLDPSRREGPRALLGLAFEAIEAGEHAQALELLQELLDHPGGEVWRPAALYWSGRQLEALGHRTPARERFGAAAEAAGLYRHLVGPTGRLPADGPATEAPGSRAPAPAPDPELARAKVLLAAGAPALALRELESLGLPAVRTARLRSRIHAQAGRVREAAMAIRPAYPELGSGRLERVPEDDLALYYPLQHLEVIRAWSEARGIPAALVAGMVRQESAFDARATSRAGARGLLQLMTPTAREVARRERIGTPTAEALYDPELSLRLGTSYLETCLAMFEGEVTLALAAYNAGPYRIRRWRREQRGVPLDLFLETMPIEEPRDYVKRVLQHRDAYLRLAPTLGTDT